MRLLFSLVTTLAWALWLGALAGLLMFVQTLFQTDRGVAEKAAPILFLTFEKYQLLVGAVALVGALAWRMSSRLTLTTAITIVLALGAASALTSRFHITPKMESLRQQGQSKSDEFKKLHGQSMIVYTLQGAWLLAAGLLIIPAIRKGSVAKPAV